MLLLLLALSLPQDRSQQLAASGAIQENAPVKASSQIIIDAPPQRVWNLLTDIDKWPTWQPEIKAAHLEGPLQPGTSFTWSTGTSIHSRIALIQTGPAQTGPAQPSPAQASPAQPIREIVWTGVAYHAHAIHLWQLEPLPGNRTLVKTRESMDGPLLTLFFSSKKLEQAHQQWLAALKAAAER